MTNRKQMDNDVSTLRNHLKEKTDDTTASTYSNHNLQVYKSINHSVFPSIVQLTCVCFLLPVGSKSFAEQLDKINISSC
jgi:hypothetical protein